MDELTTPVALILFNRPDLVAAVFATIRAARPTRLFLIADGPRRDHPAEAELCAAARAVAEQVDWPCQVERIYAGENLGCNQRIVSGLDWLFAQVEEAIILEDDVLPEPSFFAYCQSLLARYRNAERVLGIGGYNALGEWSAGDSSYVIHRLPAIWGWATWRRAWQRCDLRLSRYRHLDVHQQLAAHLPDAQQVAYRQHLYDASLENSSISWDIQWSLISCLVGGLWISPATNLITNIGFDLRATHNRTMDDLRSRTRAGAMPLPPVHPRGELADAIDDRFDRWVFLLQMLNTYRDVRALWTWQRAMQQRPELTMPGIQAGGRPFLAPLADPVELGQVLDHLAAHVDEHPRLYALRATLATLPRSATDASGSRRALPQSLPAEARRGGQR